MSKDRGVSFREITECVSVFLLLKKWSQELHDRKYIDEIEAWKMITKEKYIYVFFKEMKQDYSSDNDYETSCGCSISPCADFAFESIAEIAHDFIF